MRNGIRQTKRIELVVKNEGSFPVVFNKVFLAIDNKQGTGEMHCTIVPGSNVVEISGLALSVAAPWIGPGTHLVKGKLYLSGKESEFIPFEKKVVIPD